MLRPGQERIRAGSWGGGVTEVCWSESGSGQSGLGRGNQGRSWWAEDWVTWRAEVSRSCHAPPPTTDNHPKAREGSGALSHRHLL